MFCLFPNIKYNMIRLQLLSFFNFDVCLFMRDEFNFEIRYFTLIIGGNVFSSTTNIPNEANNGGTTKLLPKNLPLE